MQYGACPHRTAKDFHFLNEHFDYLVIILDYYKHTGSDMDWAFYFPDFTLCDFPSVYVERAENVVYRKKPQMTVELKMFAEYDTIPAVTLGRDFPNFVLRHVFAANGEYIENMVF